MISIRNAEKSFGTRKVLRDVSLTLQLGEIVFLLGRSGQGKSVLLRSLVGLETLDAGTIQVDDRDVSSEDPEMLYWLRRRCGLVFQNPALLDSLSVRDNLLFGLRAHAIFSTEEERVAFMLERLAWVGLEKEILPLYPKSLAFGVQKRVALLRAVLVQPEYLLFDEPTTGLDPATTDKTNELIRRVVDKLGAGALVVSHDLRSAFALADRIVLLQDGRWVFQGTPSEFQQSELPLAIAFRKGSGLC